MNEFAKDEATGEKPAKVYVKWNDPFMRLKTGLWGPKTDLSIAKQAKVARKAVGVPSVLKQMAQKAREVASAGARTKVKGKRRPLSRRKGK